MRSLLDVLLAVPAVLSALVLAAHFLRGQSLTGVAVALLIIPLVMVPRMWARRMAQVMLVLGSLEWLRTMWALMHLRQEIGQPWQRMAIILGSVAAFTLLAAVLLAVRPVPVPPVPDPPI